MANLGKVVYLSEAQKNTLFTNGSVTVDGTTVTYNANDLYMTPTGIDSEPTANSTNLITSGAVYNGLIYPYMYDITSVYPESMRARFRTNIGVNAFTIEYKNLSEQSINANASKAFDIDVAKTGYTPVGILGYGLEYPSNAAIYYAALTGTNTVVVKVRNNAGSAASSLNIFVYVLYIKNDT